MGVTIVITCSNLHMLGYGPPWACKSGYLSIGGTAPQPVLFDLKNMVDILFEALGWMRVLISSLKVKNTIKW